MSRLKPAFFALPICIICFLICVIRGYASEESLTITTYYPSPYGSYRELRSQRIAIGDNYINGATYSWDNGTINANADLVVEGNVGIGTTSPGELLQLATNENITIGGYSYLGNTYSQGGTVLGYNAKADTVNNVSDQVIVAQTNANIGYQFIRMSDNGGMQFHILDASVTAGDVANAEKMRITRTGNVGIGTTNPGAKLEVAGQIKITGGSPGVNKVLISGADGLASWGGTASGGLYVCPSKITCDDGQAVSGDWASYGCLGHISFRPYCTHYWASGGVKTCSNACTYLGKVLVN